MGISRATREVKTVTIEYDFAGRRVQKTFTDIAASRSFYATKMKCCKNPKIVAASRGG